MTLAMVVAVLSVFTYGMVIVIPGSIKLRLVERVNLDDAQMGRVITLWQVTTLVLTLAVGAVMDAVGHRPVLVCGFLFVGLAICCFAMVRRPIGVFAAAALLGVGGSCVNTGGNTLLPALSPSNPAAASNLGNVFFGLGAFVVPFLISFLFKRLRYSVAVAIFGVAAFCGIIPALVARYPPVRSVYQLSAAVSLLGNNSVIVAGVMLFCMVGIEVSLASWTTTYFRKIGFADHRASLVFSMLWACKIVGRLIAAQVVTTAIGKTAIQVTSLASAVGLLILTLTMNQRVAVACVALLGLVFGPVFPTTVGVTFAKFSPSLYGSIFAIIYSVGLLGSSLVPALIGYYSKIRSIRTGYGILAMLAALLFVFAWAL